MPATVVGCQNGTARCRFVFFPPTVGQSRCATNRAIVGAAETFEEDTSIADWDRRQSKLASYGCIDHASGVLNSNEKIQKAVGGYFRDPSGTSEKGGSALEL
jgi:hypothetical protein